jgi:predicted porin
MKKSLFAIAAVTAFAGVAHAQSSVTVYGVLDESYSSIKKTAGVGTATSGLTSITATTQGLKDSAWASNRFGLMGSEDLGGGTKTVFQVESDLTITSADPALGGLGSTGTTKNMSAPFPSLRQGFLGLDNAKLGKLTAGYQYTPEYFQRIYNIAGSANTLGASATASGNGGIAVQSRGTIDQFNGFAYASPTFYNTQLLAGFGTINATVDSGFTATTATTASSGQSIMIPAIAGNQAITQTGQAQYAGLKWAAGKADATVSYSSAKAKNSLAYVYSLGGIAVTTGLGPSSVGTEAAFNSSQTNVTASGSYDFGVVKVMGIAANRQITDLNGYIAPITNVTMYSIGAFVPLTPTIKLGANFGTAHQGAKGVESKNNAGQVSVQYMMSKRTTAYLLGSRATMSSPSGFATSASTTTTQANQFSLGMMHSF